MVMASVLNFHRLTVEFVQGDADFRLDGVSGGVSLQMFFRFLLLLFDVVRLVDQVGSSLSHRAEDTRLTGDRSDGCRPV